MDRVIEQKKGIRAVFRKKNIPYFLAGIFVIFVTSRTSSQEYS